MNKLVLLISVLMTFVHTQAGGNEKALACQVEIQVRDAQFGDALIGAQVQLKDNHATVFTDPDGIADLGSINALQGQVLEVSYISFETVEITLDNCAQRVVVLL